jgi:hypothetical protein
MFPGSSDSSKSIVTIWIDNIPENIPASGLEVNFGGYDATFRRVAFTTWSTIAIEVNTPAHILRPGKVTMVVQSLSGTSSWSAYSDFNFKDPQYVLTNLESYPLAFPSSDAQPFKVSVSNLPINEFGAADEVVVSFAGVSAQSFSVESVIGNLMTLLITPPTYKISTSGSSTVILRVSLRSDVSIFAETHVEFYEEPTFTAEFDKKGTGVFLVFDQRTGIDLRFQVIYFETYSDSILTLFPHCH